nr:FAD/NAD(P)-binding oxidoreductase [Burkholderia cepacia]
MTAQSGGKRDYDHVLIGGGIASVSAAHALRREDPSARIAILCGERALPYQRQPLAKEFLAGNLAPAAITIHPAGFYEMRRIDLLLGAGVASVDCGAHVVKLEDGSAI